MVRWAGGRGRASIARRRRQRRRRWSAAVRGARGCRGAARLLRAAPAAPRARHRPPPHSPRPAQHLHLHNNSAGECLWRSGRAPSPLASSQRSAGASCTHHGTGSAHTRYIAFQFALFQFTITPSDTRVTVDHILCPQNSTGRST